MCGDIQTRYLSCRSRHEHLVFDFIPCPKKKEYELDIDNKGCNGTKSLLNTLNQPCPMCVMNIVCSRLPWVKDFFKPEEDTTAKVDSEVGDEWWFDNDRETPTGPDPEDESESSTSTDIQFWSDDEKGDSWSQASSILDDAAEVGEWDRKANSIKPKAGW